MSVSTLHGCLLHGTRVVIPPSLQPQVLELLHLGHFGIQQMKQLARTAVYWPRIDTDITNQCHQCQTCAEHQTKPAKTANHPWMLPEKPWSRIQVDHAVNFLGTNWLVLVDAYSKYPCIHPTTSMSTKATTDLLEQDWITAHNRLRQCYNILFRGISGMVSGKGHYSPHRCTQLQMEQRSISYRLSNKLL